MSTTTQKRFVVKLVGDKEDHIIFAETEADVLRQLVKEKHIHRVVSIREEEEKAKFIAECKGKDYTVEASTMLEALQVLASVRGVDVTQIRNLRKR
jgi:hypothetical protein